jgi:hypothetical protein
MIHSEALSKIKMKERRRKKKENEGRKYVLMESDTILVMQ